MLSSNRTRTLAWSIITFRFVVSIGTVGPPRRSPVHRLPRLIARPARLARMCCSSQRTLAFDPLQEGLTLSDLERPYGRQPRRIGKSSLVLPVTGQAGDHVVREARVDAGQH